MGEARRQRRANDAQVRKLIERMNRGGYTPSMAEVMAVCPYRSILAQATTEAERDGGYVALGPPSCVVTVLGFTPEDFSPAMRADIEAALEQGDTVLLTANRAELRDYAKRELGVGPGLASMRPAGHA
jgi:hypothetical protein